MNSDFWHLNQMLQKELVQLRAANERLARRQITKTELGQTLQHLHESLRAGAAILSRST